MKVCLVLTHQCNLGCSYCYAGEKFKRAMSYEDGVRSLRLAFAKPGPLEVSFFGGEPMIAFDQMARLTRLARRWADRSDRHLRFAVTTNATILNEKHLRFLRDYDFFVGLSIDGLEEEHDRHRPFAGGRGSGQLVWRNLENAVDYLRDFRVLMVVRPDTISRLPQAIEKMYRLGVSKISLLPEVEADWSFSREPLEQVYSQLAQVCYLSLLTEEPLSISPFYDQHPGIRSLGQSKTGCQFGRNEVAVSPAGNFYPCARLVGPDTRAEVRIGDLKRGFDYERIEELNACSQKSLSKCGSGGCQCLALMPGDVPYQLKNVKIFTEITGLACQRATRTLEEVAA